MSKDNDHDIDNSIRPSSLPRAAFNEGSVIARSLRRLREHAGRAYIKAIALDWRLCDFTPFAATDGRYLFLNPAGIEFLKQQEDGCGLISFLLMHEVKHAELIHPLRLDPDRFPDRSRANIAADYVVNDQIHRINVAAGMVCAGKYPFPLIDGCLHDPAISQDYSVEELYGVLWNPKGSKGKPCKDGTESEEGLTGTATGESGDEGAGDKEKDTGSNDGEGGKENKQPGQPGNNETGGAAGETGAGAKSGDVAAETDPDKGGAAGHATHSGAGAGGGSGATAPTLADLPGTGTADLRQPVLEPNETFDGVQDEMNKESERIQIQESLSVAGRGGGGSDRAVLDRPPVRLDWREYLAHWLLARAASAWNKPINVPIYSATGLVSAGRDQSVLNELVVGADSSGSIGDNELGQILGSVRHAVEAIRFDIMHLLACDWRIRAHYEIAANDLSNMPSTVPGGGGTRFEPVFTWQQHNAPDAPIIYLTDGHATDLSYLPEPDVPVLWLSWDKPVNQYPFGDAVRIWL